MSRLFLTLCGADEDFLECRNYNDGTVKKIRTCYRNREKTLSTFTSHTLHLVEYDEDTYEQVRKEADGYEIYIVNEWGFDNNKDNSSSTEYEARPIRDDEIVVFDGKFVGAAYVDVDGNGKKLCKGMANIALVTDVEKISGNGTAVDSEDEAHGITRAAFIAYRGECCVVGVVSDWSFDSMYLRKKEDR